MPVDSRHPDYDHIKAKWKLTRAVVANDARDYIRTVDVNDLDRSRQYKEDAILTNFTGLTKVGLTGLVFRKEPKIQVPEALIYLEDDATGDGITLEQLAQRAVGEILQTGRLGLLVDYPVATPDVSFTDEEEFGMLCRIKPYTAESIINWRTKQVGSKNLLSMVVLYECINDVAEDGFSWVTRDQYRVLLLDSVGEYIQVVYDENHEVVNVIKPLNYDSQPFKDIPFVFIGSQNNDVFMDTIPLYDLAILNIGHYRNSADYEESVFITGQPTVFLSVDGSPEEFAAANPGGIKFGARRGYNIGVNGKAVLLQSNPNQLADAAMRRKEEQAVSIGARFIAPAGGRETAEAARIRYNSQNSALYIITNNISEGIELALKICAVFMMPRKNINLEEIEFELNTEFYDETTDPNLLAQMMMGFDRNFVSLEEIRGYLRRTGAIDDSVPDSKLENLSHIIDPLQSSTDVKPDVTEE